MKTEVEDIAQQLLEIIKNEVNNEKHDDSKYKNHYECVMEELESELNYINRLIQEHTDDNLKLNTIEAEGYKRCLITMINRFRDFEKYM